MGLTLPWPYYELAALISHPGQWELQRSVLDHSRDQRLQCDLQITTTDIIPNFCTILTDLLPSDAATNIINLGW